MITPQFEVDQDDDFVYMKIHAPFIKASLIQFEIFDNVFVFSLPPYYLRVRLPGSVVEDERMSSSYSLSTSTVQCKLPKLHKGEHFEDLDMISKLLATKSEHEGLAKPKIDEVDASASSSREEPISADFDWEINQVIEKDDRATTKYGFNDQYSERIAISLHLSNEINELADPEHEPVCNRLTLLRKNTIEQFDPEHFLADMHDRETVDELLHYDLPTNLQLAASSRDRIARLSQRKFILNNTKATYLGVIPLIFAWAYDNRTNLGEPTVESSWTVGKLCPAMCYLYNHYSTVVDIVNDCTARALTKPLYRNWDLVTQVWADTVQIMKGSKRNILAVFGRLLEIFENDLHGVYRHILLEDYTIWIQFASADVLTSMVKELEKVVNTLRITDSYLPLAEEPPQVKGKNPQGDSDDDSEYEDA